MSDPVHTKDPASVRQEVQKMYEDMFPAGDRDFVGRVFEWIEQCFTGRYAGYQAIDARYHDLEHTLQGTLCFARLLHGRHRAKAQPVLSQKMFELGLIAILFHDTGYLKQKGDNDGSGAKYTAVHVSRSAAFAQDFLSRKGFSETDIAAVQNMIRCTGIDANLPSIPFQSDTERLVGYALGTGDLLGQMAAPDYVEKLPVLYQEFAEATQYDPGHAESLREFTSAQDLMRKTPLFWQRYVLPRLNRDFGNLQAFLSDPYPGGQNLYLRQIEENLGRIKSIA